MVGGLQHFSVSPSPLGTNLVLELNETRLGLGLGGFGTKGLGPGLDNKIINVCVFFYLDIVSSCHMHIWNQYIGHHHSKTFFGFQFSNAN